MRESRNWDWNTKEKLITTISEWKKQFPVIHEFVVSNDGEKISAVVEIENKKVTHCINGKTWGNTYERIWSPQFSTDNRLICSVLQNYEWTVAIDNNLWEEKYDFVWNMTFNPNGKDIAVNIKKDNEYGVSLNSNSWVPYFFSHPANFILSGIRNLFLYFSSPQRLSQGSQW